MHSRLRTSPLQKSLSALITLVVVMRALLAPPCEHHAMPSVIAAGHYNAHGDHTGSHGTPSNTHNQAQHGSDGKAPADTPAHEDGCTCIGNCTTGAPTFLPTPQVSLAHTTETAASTVPVEVVHRIADRTPSALPWATAPPASPV